MDNQSIYQEFDGTAYQSETTTKFVIFTCADCTKAQVAIFDRGNLRLLYKYNLDKKTMGYSLSTYEPDVKSLQIYIGGSVTVDRILF
jgi:hypothetical protein